MDYYNKSVDSILKEFNSSKEGLNSSSVKSKQSSCGPNSIISESKVNPIKIFIDQFKSFIIYILLFAVVFSLFVGEYVDAVIILIILIANAVIGFIQEFNAYKSLQSLKDMQVLKTRVIRNKKTLLIDSIELVPGDIVFLEAGDKVPADIRLFEATRLKVEESALTGESLSVSKNIDLIKGTVALGDQSNMLFSSTSISQGSARGIVVKIGMDTQVGAIASMINETQTQTTPLQRRLDSFGKKLGYVIIGICLLVFALSFGKDFLVNGYSPASLFAFIMIAISLAVAAVPTALPAVVTIALSLGVKKLLKNNCLVRKLSSVETLGSCDVICSDKTGTLTKNQMTVRSSWTLDGLANFTGGGYSTVGNVSSKLNPLLYSIGLFCNNSSLEKKGSSFKITGDPTEAALLVSAKKAKSTSIYSRLDELPFDSDRKLMSVLVKQKSSLFTFTKGAPDCVLSVCSHVIVNGKSVKLTPKIKNQILSQNDDYANNSLRVLGFAYKKISSKKDFSESKLIFVGLQAMIDPPRDDVIDSIKTCQAAGIRVIMITGDYAQTALSIAGELGLPSKGVITGLELEKISDSSLTKKLVDGYNIFARVAPIHKQRIITLLQKLKHVVAMTGDGVNDAPALKKANIGVAVGSGTDVAKESSDLILLDDSFSNLVNTVREGRGIYENIQKSIMLLLSGNLGEVLIIFLAILFGFNLPLTAVLLLWINLVTDGAPAIAYALDPYGDHIMKEKPRRSDEPILPWHKTKFLLFLGVIGTFIALYLFNYVGGNGDNLILAQTMVFNFVVLYELILAFVIRKSYGVKSFSNKWLWISIVGSLALQAVLMYTPLSGLFEIIPLSLSNLGLLGLAGLVFFVISLSYTHIHIRRHHKAKN